MSKDNLHLVLFTSMSGNTAEMADIIIQTLNLYGKDVVAFRADINGRLQPYDYYGMTKQYKLDEVLSKAKHLWLGTYTWDDGTEPEEMGIVIDNLSNELRGMDVRVFGSGDTQFGGDLLFCKACDILNVDLEGKREVIKVEQSPRGKQSESIVEWVKGNLT